MMIDMDDPDHLRRRKLVNKGFTPNGSGRSATGSARWSTDWSTRSCERGSCDLVTDIAGWLPLVMIGDALGVAPEDHPTLLQWSDDLMQGQGQTDEALLMAMIGAFDGYSSYIAEVIADRRGCPRDDLMSILCHAEVDGDRLDDDAVAPRVAPHPDRRRRDDAPRDHRRAVPVAHQRPRRMGAPAGRPLAHPVRGRGVAALGLTDQEHGPHRHPGRRAARQADPGRREAPAALPVGQPRRVHASPTR